MCKLKCKKHYEQEKRIKHYGIPAYEIQLREEADREEAIWCKLVTGHKTVTMGVVYRCPNITKESNEKLQNAIREVSKGDCIVMGDFTMGHTR